MYADHEIGAAVRMALEGMSYLDIATELGITTKQIRELLSRVMRIKAERAPSKVPPVNRGAHHRPSCLTPEEREKACRWKDNGLSVPVIARRLRCSQGAVRWVTEEGKQSVVRPKPSGDG
jgi:hypothetical protein